MSLVFLRNINTTSSNTSKKVEIKLNFPRQPNKGRRAQPYTPRKSRQPQRKQDHVADASRRNNARNSPGFANPSPMQVHTKSQTLKDWENSELCSPNGISISPTTNVGDILFQTPLRVDAYPGSLLEREMVQWERWRLKEWGFSFGTLKSKMEAGAVIAFWEPDPKVVHVSSPQLATYAYAHSKKLKISAFENRTLSVRPTPGDNTERYCLSKGSDDRLTTYGTIYVVYLGGANVTASTVFWTLEHHQTIDWAMRDMDPLGTANAQNEGTATSPPVTDLLSGMTFTPGGVDPTLDTSGSQTEVVFNPASVGSANNILITAVTQITSNSGVQIPFETSATIQGVVHDVTEAADHIDPETSAEMVSQYICGGNEICRIALKGAASALIAFAVQRVKFYINTLPGNITSLNHPDLGRYQPPAVSQIFRRQAEASHTKLKALKASNSEVSSLIYSSIDVEGLIDAIPGDKQGQNITSFMTGQELVNTGITPTYNATATTNGPAVYLSRLSMGLKGGAVGDTILFFFRANSPEDHGGTAQGPTSSGIAPVLNRWWSDPDKGMVYMVAGTVSDPNNLGILVQTEYGTGWATYGKVGWFELEVHYSTSLPAVMKALKGRLPITYDHTGKALAIDRFASSGSVVSWNTQSFTSIAFRNLPYEQYRWRPDSKVSGILLDQGVVGNQAFALLRSLPSGMTGWLHFHFYVSSSEDYPNATWDTFSAQGSRISVPTVNDAITVGPREAVYMFKMLVPTGSGETGIIWDGPVIESGNFFVSNYYFGFTQIESEADERLAAFKKTVKEKSTKKWTKL